MKFTNGNWLVREGVQLHPAISVCDVKFEADAVTLYAMCKTVRGRMDMLDGPMLTIRLSSPIENAIRVQVEHFSGRPAETPEFDIPSISKSPITSRRISDNVVELRAGNMSAAINCTAWAIDFRRGDALLTSSPSKALAYVTNSEGAFMRDELSLGVGEYVYGLGERFTSFIKNGQVVEIWNRDGGTGTEQAYKNVPFYMTNHGYGVFINHPGRISLEVASEHVSRVQFSVSGEKLDYIVMAGQNAKEIVQRYTELTGRPALPPAWSFGLWLTTSFTTDYSESVVNSLVDGMYARNIPLHVFHFDCFWMKEHEWCNFEWNSDSFPDPRSMLLRLKERGLHICVWINPYIAQKSRLFAEGAANGYLVKRPSGDVWQWDLWQPGMGLVDFTNPDACVWYASKLKNLLDMGVDCFKTDFGERIPTDVVYFDGSSPDRMHNYYSLLYNRVVFSVLRKERGTHEAIVFARSATAGSQRYPVHWGGDSTSTYESMAESLRGGLSLSLSGFGFWSHDIGGFENTSSPDVYKRWIAFGMLSSHSRLHGSSSFRVPWLFDEESVTVLRHFVHLKCRLMPYLYSVAVEAAEGGVPMMRPMMMEFPDDPASETLDRQYMLGASLLVAPVFSQDGKVTYYLPAGRWTHYSTGRIVEGERWITEEYGYLDVPLFVRPNSIIAVGDTTDRPDYDYASNVTYELFELACGTNSVKLYDTDGSPSATFTSITSERTASLLLSGTSEPCRVIIHGVSAVTSVTGAEYKETPGGIVVDGVQPDQPVTIRYQV